MTPYTEPRLLRWLDALATAGSWLALPLAMLLFAQWPLREVAGAGASRANDLAQTLFALYVALALHTATREQAHLAADMAATHRQPGPVRQALMRWGHALAVLPFSLFVVFSGAPMVWQSVRALESFPETFNPGYFLIKVAALLLAMLMSLQAVLGLRQSAPTAP